MDRNRAIIPILAVLCVVLCSSKPVSRGHQYVDLGLSVCWATCNLGADVPTDDGSYVCWGETMIKDTCTVWNYKWCDGFYWNRNFTKYYSDDGLTELSRNDDAASMNWGGDWRTPTRAEQDELRENCDWKWEDNYKGSGVSGYVVSSRKYTGRSIFLPASGDKLGSSIRSHGIRGFYMSSTKIEGDDKGACSIHFEKPFADWLYCYRYYGQTLRPVIPRSRR